MTRYDYKAVAAPRRPGRFKGVAKGADSYARTVEELIAAEVSEGWEYYRAESLPSEEKSGWLSRRQTVIHSILIFRRARPEAGASLAEKAEAESGVLRLDPAMREDEAAEPAAPSAPAGPRLGPATS